MVKIMNKDQQLRADIVKRLVIDPFCVKNGIDPKDVTLTIKDKPHITLKEILESNDQTPV